MVISQGYRRSDIKYLIKYIDKRVNSKRFNSERFNEIETKRKSETKRKIETAFGKKQKARKSNCKQKKFEVVMDEFSRKKLKTSAGKKVTNRKQAVAIAYSVSRRYCKFGANGVWGMLDGVHRWLYPEEMDVDIQFFTEKSALQKEGGLTLPEVLERWAPGNKLPTIKCEGEYIVWIILPSIFVNGLKETRAGVNKAGEWLPTYYAGYCILDQQKYQQLRSRKEFFNGQFEQFKNYIVKGEPMVNEDYIEATRIYSGKDSGTGVHTKQKIPQKGTKTTPPKNNFISSFTKGKEWGAGQTSNEQFEVFWFGQIFTHTDYVSQSITDIRDYRKILKSPFAGTDVNNLTYIVKEDSPYKELLNSSIFFYSSFINSTKGPLDTTLYHPPIIVACIEGAKKLLGATHDDKKSRDSWRTVALDYLSKKTEILRIEDVATEQNLQEDEQVVGKTYGINFVCPKYPKDGKYVGNLCDRVVQLKQSTTDTDPIEAFRQLLGLDQLHDFGIHLSTSSLFQNLYGLPTSQEIKTPEIASRIVYNKTWSGSENQFKSLKLDGDSQEWIPSDEALESGLSYAPFSNRLSKYLCKNSSLCNVRGGQVIPITVDASIDKFPASGLSQEMLRSLCMNEQMKKDKVDFSAAAGKCIENEINPIVLYNSIASLFDPASFNTGGVQLGTTKFCTSEQNNNTDKSGPVRYVIQDHNGEALIVVDYYNMSNKSSPEVNYKSKFKKDAPWAEFNINWKLFSNRENGWMNFPQLEVNGDQITDAGGVVPVTLNQWGLVEGFGKNSGMYVPPTISAVINAYNKIESQENSMLILLWKTFGDLMQAVASQTPAGNFYFVTQDRSAAYLAASLNSSVILIKSKDKGKGKKSKGTLGGLEIYKSREIPNKKSTVELPNYSYAKDGVLFRSKSKRSRDDGESSGGNKKIRTTFNPLPGEKVTVKYEKEGPWKGQNLAAKIIQRNSNNTFKIEYDDAVIEDNVLPERIKKFGGYEFGKKVKNEEKKLRLEINRLLQLL